MSDVATANARPRDPGVNFRKILTGGVLVLAVGLSIALVFRFIDEAREHDLLAWQVRSGIVADSRAGAVDGWVAGRFDDLRDLAANPTLPVYLTELAETGGAATPEADYLRNLLIVSADRLGFAGTALGPDVPANVTRTGIAGLLLLDNDGRLLVGTPNPPPLAGDLRDFVERLTAGGWSSPDGSALLDIHRASTGLLTMAFAVPVFSVHGDPSPASQTGFLIGIRPVAGALFPLLDQPGTTEESAEILLIRREVDVIRYLSPLADGTAPLARQLDRATAGLAAAWALDHPDAFGQHRDYAGNAVLATGRVLTAAPWTLLYKIDVAEALGPTEARLKRLLVILLLAVGLTAAGMVALWYKGASRRASEAARTASDMAARYERQRDFMTLLTDSQPSANAVVDRENRYSFANMAAASLAGMDRRDMIGKTLTAVLGAAAAKPYEALNAEAIASNSSVTGLHRFERGGGERITQSRHVPMPGAGDTPPGVLLVETDITDTIVERERRERMLRQLIDTLVGAVDRRDPNAANHSRRVGTVAAAIAGEMDLDAVLVETVSVSGQLMNLGKLLVPVDLLTRREALSEDEMRQVRGGLQASADLISGIEFDGPVVETLRQCQERIDGTGAPKGLGGEDIILPARIVGVANAFIALISPRAHRDGFGFDRALQVLGEEAGTAWDSRVVTALTNFVENKGGREAWADFQGGRRPAN